MDRLRWFIESDLVERTRVYPTLKGIFEYTREDGSIYYRFELKDKLKFLKEVDYAAVKTHSVDECKNILVTCERACGGSYAPFWKGKFTYFNTVVHLDRCWIEADVEPDDDYACYLEIEKNEINVFDSGEVIEIGSVTGTYETRICFYSFSEIDGNSDEVDLDENGNLPPNSACLADPENWGLKSNRVVLDFCEYDRDNDIDECHYDHITEWHREVIRVDCVSGAPSAPEFGSGWQLLSNECSTDGKATWWRVPPTSQSSNGTQNLLGPYKYGRKLEHVLETLLAEADCSLQIKSDFFGINPVGDAPNNIAYDYALEYLQDVTIHHLSDIVNPDASNPSSSPAWVMKPRDLLDDLRKMCKVFYDIVDGVFILEHYSYFSKNRGLNLVNHPMELKIEYGGNDHDQFERYKFATSQSALFRAPDVRYDCGDGEKEIQTVLLSADLGHIERSASEESELEGFAIAANYVVDGAHTLINNNEPFRWTNLLNNLHLHGASYKTGKIGNTPVNFLSWQPYIKQEKLNYTLCCDQPFNPNDTIETPIGDASVGAAELNGNTGKLTLELMY